MGARRSEDMGKPGSAVLIASPGKADASKYESESDTPQSRKARPISFVVLKDVLFWGSILVSGLSLYLLLSWMLS
jgi:hypothetical protein